MVPRSCPIDRRSAKTVESAHPAGRLANVVQSRRPPLFLYDGDCAFCSASARFIERRIPTPDTEVVPWQRTELEPLGVTLQEADESVVHVDAELHRTFGPVAIARLLRSSSSPLWRSLGAILGGRATLLVAWPAYRWIARNRHRMPGGTATCSLPAAERPAAATDATPDPELEHQR
jgi:predicted DCC family thiol-disulfide oxidoreductase YuxK